MTVNVPQKNGNFGTEIKLVRTISGKDKGVQIKVVKILQELVESELKAYPKHQRERWTNIS